MSCRFSTSLKSNASLYDTASHAHASMIDSYRRPAKNPKKASERLVWSFQELGLGEIYRSPIR
jgi:hypothetical protein